MRMSQQEETDFRWSPKSNILLLVTIWLTVLLLTASAAGEQALSVPEALSNITDNSNYFNGGDAESRRASTRLASTWNLPNQNKKLEGFSVMENMNQIQDENEAEDFPLGNQDDPGNKDHYTHQWALHILGGPEVARKAAEKHGFQFHGEVRKNPILPVIRFFFVKKSWLQLKAIHGLFYHHKLSRLLLLFLSSNFHLHHNDDMIFAIC